MIIINHNNINIIDISSNSNRAPHEGVGGESDGGYLGDFKDTGEKIMLRAYAYIDMLRAPDSIWG